MVSPLSSSPLEGTKGYVTVEPYASLLRIEVEFPTANYDSPRGMAILLCEILSTRGVAVFVVIVNAGSSSGKGYRWQRNHS